MTITAHELAAATFGLITDENAFRFPGYGWNKDDHNELAVDLCAAFLAVYGDVYNHERHHSGVRGKIEAARNTADANKISVAEALRRPSAYESQYGRAAALDLAAEIYG